MAALPIIKHFEIFEDLLRGLFPGLILAMMNAFPLQGAQEALDAGVVLAIPSTRPTPRDTSSLQMLLVGCRRIRTPTIGMGQEAGLRLAPMVCHLYKACSGRFPRQPRPHRPPQ